jgi:molecular chaperone Hsp33
MDPTGADSDMLQRFLFTNAPVRGQIVHLNATFRAALERRAYPESVRAVLGEFMAAAALLTATLKFQGRLTLQVQGEGPVRLLVVECTSESTLRATAQWEGEVAPAPLAELVGAGRLAITIEPRKGKERYQGIVSVEGTNVAQALERYFAQSEQLATRLWLATDAQHAVGMLLQQLPGAAMDDDLWVRAVELGSTITPGELLDLSVRQVLHRLYHEEDLRLFAATPVSFRCSCSRERVESVLRMLGRDEVHDILSEQGAVDVDCEFCGRHYHFDAVDAEQLFVPHPVAGSSATRH